MTYNKIKEMLNRPAGQFLSLEYERECKVKKGAPTIRKHTKLTARIGCKYDNLGAVQAKRENGELPVENQGLNGLEWLDYPSTLRNPKTGKIFLRVETLPNSKPSVTFTVDGKPTTKETISDYLYSGEKTSKENIDTFNVNIEDIITIK